MVAPTRRLLQLSLPVSRRGRLVLSGVALLGIAAAPAVGQTVMGDHLSRQAAAARADSTRYPWTKADADFMAGMIRHHAQAIEMASLAPSRTDNRTLLTLAARIINAQRDEIALMERWLRDRLQPVPEWSDAAGHHQHQIQMPGMLTPAQMDSLGRAAETKFDQLFLRYMIQHHQGAVVMVADLFAADGAAQDQTVFRFASDVQVDQRTEIGRMQRLLAAILFAEP